MTTPADSGPAIKKRKAEVNELADQASHLSANGSIVQSNGNATDADVFITSFDPLHPANHIASLCRQFYGHGWVTGTGGGVSIRRGEHVYIAPSGVQKELMTPEDMFVMDYASTEYLRRPKVSPTNAWIYWCSCSRS